MAEFQNDQLNKILIEELAQGNTIVEISTWPPKCNKIVILNRKFKKAYETSNKGIKHNNVIDSHYWHSEYITEDASECLACKFE